MFLLLLTKRKAITNCLYYNIGSERYNVQNASKDNHMSIRSQWIAPSKDNHSHNLFVLIISLKHTLNGAGELLFPHTHFTIYGLQQ
jgi:hypothetical protein